MVSSAAKTVDAYLHELPAERRDVVAAVRTMVRQHLPRDIAETMNWGMICWEIPLSRYPDTYNGQPLMVAALAAQKNHFGLYLTCVSADETRARTLAAAFAAAGKNYEAGKSCIRFQRTDDLPMAALGRILASVDVGQFIERYEAGRAASGRGARKTPAAKKVVAKKVAPATAHARKIAATKPNANAGSTRSVATRKVAANPVAAKKTPVKKAPAKKAAKKTAGNARTTTKAASTTSPARKRPSPGKPRA